MRGTGVPPVNHVQDARATSCGLVTRAAATAIAIFAGLGFIYIQRTSAHFLTIELLNSSRAFFLGLHLDEAEAA